MLIQPPRGFGENPVAIYHDPEMPPSHHYLATYRWLEEEFGAHASCTWADGNLESLPGKNVGMSGACGTDATIGSMPLIYPFRSNDPSKTTQAKRRAHARIIDHLIPPMAQQVVWRHRQAGATLDGAAMIAARSTPAKLQQSARIWTLVQPLKMDHDLGLPDRPHDAGD